MPKRRDDYRELRVERWARRIVAGDLGLVVDRYEDGSRNGMVDAVIRSPQGDVPLEVVQDVNVPETRMAVALEQHGRRLLVPGLDPGWYITLRHEANVRRVRAELPALLLSIDTLRNDRPEWATSTWQMYGEEVPRALQRLGVEFMAPLFESPGPGQVVLDGEGWGGVYEPDRLNGWVEEILAREADVPAKLRAFPGGHGDVFIWATMASDIGVSGLLTDPDVATVQRSLPAAVPALPGGVDRVWVASTLESRRAVATDGDRWRWLDWVATRELEADEGP